LRRTAIYPSIDNRWAREKGSGGATAVSKRRLSTKADQHCEHPPQACGVTRINTWRNHRPSG
jgi:hypothetical protein